MKPNINVYTQRALANMDAIRILRDAITRVYADSNPQLTIRMMDARARRLRHAMHYVSRKL